MSTFNDLLHTLKEFCDEKDRKIKMLESCIERLNKERSLIQKRFLEGDYETHRVWYD